MCSDNRDLHKVPPGEKTGFAELPKIDSARVQASESARALEDVFRLPDFIARSQNPDLGIDYEVELAGESRALNIHFSVQLKSVEEGDMDADGSSLRFAIETSRLHYLSRTLCGSLIVIYDLSRRSMFFRWVHEIVPELDAKGIDWRAQGTVTIKLPVTNMLDAASARTIHANVSVLYRRIQQSSIDAAIMPAMEATSASPSERAILERARPADDRLLSILLTSGIGLVAAGLHRQVLTTYSRLPSIMWSSDPRHLLTIAYAYEHSGQSLQALTHSTAALGFRGPKRLSTKDASFADLVRVKSRLYIGLTSLKKYYEELEVLTVQYPDTAENKHIRLELILRDMVYTRQDVGMAVDPIERMTALYAEAKSIVGPDTDLENIGPKWDAHIMLARIEFQLRNQLLMDGACCVNLAQAMGHPIPLSERVGMARQAVVMTDTALHRLQRLAEIAKTSQRPDLVALCQYEMAATQLNFLVLSHFIETEGEGTPTPGQDPELQRCLQYIEDAISVFSQLGLEMLRIRSSRLKADILIALGRRDEALALLSDLRQAILRAGLNPDFTQLTELPARPSEGEINEILDDAPDANLERHARDVIRALRLPENRFGIVLADLHWMRKIRSEQQSWCKHIELLQNLSHTRSRESLYAADPDRHCKCLRYSHESTIGSTEVEALISAFKSTYCIGCSGRET